VKGIFLACQAAIPAFRKRGGGVIINIGSTAGLRVAPALLTRISRVAESRERFLNYAIYIGFLAHVTA
jgi:NAD(P)-dependent dehydrogenase (short-subunit alcohol dehydrogenase family)